MTKRTVRRREESERGSVLFFFFFFLAPTVAGVCEVFRSTGKPPPRKKSFVNCWFLQKIAICLLAYLLVSVDVSKCRKTNSKCWQEICGQWAKKGLLTSSQSQCANPPPLYCQSQPILAIIELQNILEIWRRKSICKFQCVSAPKTCPRSRPQAYKSTNKTGE